MIKLQIQGKEYEFEEESLNYDDSKILDKEIATENLLKMKEVLDNNKVQFILAYGTLLGAIREKDFISHDIDIDIIIFDEKQLINCILDLKNEGLKLVRLEKISKTYSFMRKGVYIDVYLYENMHKFYGIYYGKLLGRVFPKKYLKNFKKIRFLQNEFLVPENSEALLKYWYGPNWMIPIKNSPSNDQSMLSRTLKRILPKKIIQIIKKNI